MTKYGEILRLASLNLSQTNIALSSSVSKKILNKVLKAVKEKHIEWPLPESHTDEILADQLFPDTRKTSDSSKKRMPDYEYIYKELLCNGVNKKLLWTESLEGCRLSGDEPLMYSNRTNRNTAQPCASAVNLVNRLRLTGLETQPTSLIQIPEKS